MRYKKRTTEDKHLQYNTERENTVVGETEISVAETALSSLSLASALPPTLKLVKRTYASRTDCQCCLASFQSCLECTPHSQTACVCLVTSSLMTAAYYSLHSHTGFHDKLAIL